MNPPPWETDRELTVELARAAIRAAFPDVDVSLLRHLGSGWEFDVFLTADGWAFRFPRRSDVQHLLGREAPILDLVAAHLAPDIAVPRIERRAPPSTSFPYAFAGYRFIEGVPADSLPDELLPTFARSIGRTLGRVHSIPIEAAAAAGVAELDRSEEGRRAWFERGLAHVEELRGVDPVVDRALLWVRGIEDPLRRLDAPLRLIHHDLSPEHVLTDPRGGHVVGIIDWTDAILGDPARDFVTLTSFGGWELLYQALESYGPGVDAGFIGRLRFMVKLLTVMWLAEAHAKGEDTRKHRIWVGNAFADAPQRGPTA